VTFSYASLCDGIGAVHVAWAPLGWRYAWTSEIDPFASAVVERRWGYANLGDMTQITKEMIDGNARPDLVVGGTPCQSFSVAGLRKGLDDPRGNLALVFLRVVGLARPHWVLWENVPGVLSVDRGRAFGSFLGALGRLGYGFAWRVLDAQFFGVPQRRRRVFVVGHLGDWRPAAAVLLEPEGLRGHPAAGGGPRAAVARALTSSTGGASGKKQQLTFVDRGGEPLNALCFGGGNTAGEIDVATCLTHHHTRQDFDTETFAVVGPLCSHSPEHGHAMTTQQAVEAGHVVTHPLTASYDASPDGTERGVPLSVHSLDLRNAGRDPAKWDTMNRQGLGVGAEGDPAPACAAGATSYTRPCVAVAFQERGRAHGRNCETQQELSYCLTSPHSGGRRNEMNIATQYAVRRLTPRECERLQGFPDDYTLIEFRDKPAGDGARYRALGNSMAVPVMAWIGRRIDLVDTLTAGQTERKGGEA
jgi:DNA (cytosine-5)-methyltransferase 1